MTVINNINDYRTNRQFVRRYLSVAPRVTVFSGQVNAISRDDATNGIYRFTYTGASGSFSDTARHMTIDFGTTAGARDLGTFRIRRAADATYVYVEEISAQESGIATGVYFSIKRDWKAVSVKPRIVATQTNASYINGFNEYHDYDISYSIQNQNIRPKANITESGSYTDGTLIQAKPAGFVDAGQTYRTVNLSSSNSIAIAPGASISSRTWDVRDGTITVGTSTSTNITVQFPVGFRWISVTVTDSNGVTDTMYFPIWVHDDSNMPITKFRRENDTSEEWRDMSFSLWGDDNEFPESVLPKGGLMCYWEVAEFDNASAPVEYLGQALIFSKKETQSIKLYESEMTLEASGIGYWLSQARSYGQKLYNKTTPTAWYEIVSLNVQRAIHYVLREYTSALVICNYFPKMTTNAVEAENIPENNAWEQIKYLAGGDEFREVKCDSLGGIWVTKPADLMNSIERSSWLVTCSIDSQDVLGESPILYPNEFIQKTSLTKGSGFSYDGTNNTIYLCQAPGKTEGYAPSSDEAPALRLGTSNPQAQLNQLVGDWWERQNNPQPQIDLPLFYNMDFAEPAYGEVIQLTFNVDSLRNTSITNLPCRLIRVSRSSNDEIGINEITWTLSPVTDGKDADYVEVPPPTEYSEPEINMPIGNIFPDSYIPVPYTPYPSPVYPPPPTPPTPYNPKPTFNVAFITKDKKLFLTSDFSSSSPTWVSHTLSLDGDVVQALADPYSPFFVNGSGAINIVVVTTQKIYTIDNIFNTRTVTTRYTFADETPLRSLSISTAFEKNAVVTSNYADRTRITTSTDLTTWTSEADYGTTGTGMCIKTTPFTASIYVRLDNHGLDTGIDVVSGTNIFVVDESGQWCAKVGLVTNFCCGTSGNNGSGAQLPSAPQYCLIGKIGTGGSWFDMSSGTAVAPASGRLYLRCNNSDIYNTDDDGTIVVDLITTAFCSPGNIDSLENSPGAYVSNKSDGRVYSSGASTGIGFVSSDNGATMTNATTVTPARSIDGKDALVGDIGIPQKGNVPSEIIGYYGQTDNRVRKLIRFRGVVTTDISPEVSGKKYGPYKSQQICCHPTQNKLLICCGIDWGRKRVGIWESSNFGDDWVVVQAPTDNTGSTGRYERATYAAGSSTLMYLWGTKGKIGIGVKIGSAWNVQSKVGNINQSTTGEIINIFVAGGLAT